MGIAIRLAGVDHEYSRTSESGAVHALRGISASIEAGEFVALMGPSGSGKSTLLNLVGGIDRPTRGSVFIGETETSSLGEAELALVRRRSIGFVFQFFNLIPTLSVAENVEFPLALLAVPAAERRRRVEEVLARVGLAARGRHLPSELSGGEMQRCAIARAIAHRPPLILADEPTGNLDVATGDTILALLGDIHASEQSTIIMATHSERAAKLAGRRLEVVDGRLTAAAA